MTFRMILQLWNTNTPAIVSCDADLTENYMYISMKFRTGVHVFCWEVGVFNRSCFQSVSCKSVMPSRLGKKSAGWTVFVIMLWENHVKIFTFFSYIVSYLIVDVYWQDILYAYFLCPGWNDRGHIVFVLSVCLFVCCQL